MQTSVTLRGWRGMAGLVCAGALLCSGWLYAAPTQIPVSWSFEDDAPGTVYVATNGTGILGWSGPSASGATTDLAWVIAETYTYTNGFHPMFSSHSNVLNIAGTISNVFEEAHYTNVIVDCMIQPGHLSYEPGLTGSPQLAMFVDTNGALVVRHSAGGSNSRTQLWTRLSNEPIASNEWARVRIEMDYYTSGAADNANYYDTEHYFTITLNNAAEPISSPMAYSSAYPETWPDPDGGPWFLCPDWATAAQEGMNPNEFITALEIQGAGKLDDLYVYGTGPTGSTSIATAFDDWVALHEPDGSSEDPQNGDWDNDGRKNWEEYLSGTDPTNALSVFKVINQAQINGTNWIAWLDGTNAGVTSLILMYRSTDLVQGWDLVDDTIQRSTTGTNQWWDLSTPAVPAYYQPRLTNDFQP